MGISSEQPPLLPSIDAIAVLDGDGNRLAGKYYNGFLSGNIDDTPPSEQSADMRRRTEELRSAFERQVHGKIQGISARADAAEVLTIAGKTVVFCGGTNGNATGAPGNGGGGDVRVILVGPTGESELVLAHFCEGMFEALSNLMGGVTDRTMVLDNLELVLLLIDEHCDGGIVLETDPNKLVASVVLRDEEEMMQGGQGMDGAGGGPMNQLGNNPSGEMTMAQAFRQARDQFITNLGNRDGM